MSSESLDRHLERLRRGGSPRLVLVDEPATRPKSIALLSGSFDPMTVAHAALADGASRLVDLVLLVYSARTLPKEGTAPPALLSEADRLKVLERFCETHPKTAVGLCSHGLLADQVMAVRERFPTQALFMVVGSDKVLQLLDPNWYEDRDAALEELFREAQILYAERAGEQGLVASVLRRPQNARWRDRFIRLEFPEAVASISSRSVRTMVAAGRDPADVVVREARPYIPSIDPDSE
jgi:nicotinic acid mononucleotide adenylyltransferase